MPTILSKFLLPTLVDANFLKVLVRRSSRQPGGMGGGMGGGLMGGCETKIDESDCLSDSNCGWKYEVGDTSGAGECTIWSMSGKQSCADWAASVTGDWRGKCGGAGGATAGGATQAPAAQAPTASPATAAAPATATAPATAAPACPPPPPCPACPAPPPCPAQAPALPPPAFYTGTLGDTVSHKNKHITYPKPVQNGVLILGTPTFDGPHPGVVSISKQDNAGADIYFDEPDECYDRKHTTEKVDWLVDTPGIHKTDQDLPYILGFVELTPDMVKKTWGRVDFPSGTFKDDNILVILNLEKQETPSQFLSLRVNKVTSTGFNFKGELALKKKGSKHGSKEMVGYIALPISEGSINGKKYFAGRTGRKVNHSWFTQMISRPMQNPSVFMQIQTYFGPDTSTVRRRKLVTFDAAIIDGVVADVEKQNLRWSKGCKGPITTGMGLSRIDCKGRKRYISWDVSKSRGGSINGDFEFLIEFEAKSKKGTALSVNLEGTSKKKGKRAKRGTDVIGLDGSKRRYFFEGAWTKRKIEFGKKSRLAPKWKKTNKMVIKKAGGRVSAWLNGKKIVTKKSKFGKLVKIHLRPWRNHIRVKFMGMVNPDGAGQCSRLEMMVHELTKKCGWHQPHTTEDIGYVVFSN